MNDTRVSVEPWAGRNQFSRTIGMLPFGALPLPVTAATSPRGAWHAPCLTHSLLLRSRTEILQDVPGLAPGTHPKASQLGPETGCSYGLLGQRCRKNRPKSVRGPWARGVRAVAPRCPAPFSCGGRCDSSCGWFSVLWVGTSSARAVPGTSSFRCFLKPGIESPHSNRFLINSL